MYNSTCSGFYFGLKASCRYMRNEFYEIMIQLVLRNIKTINNNNNNSKLGWVGGGVPSTRCALNGVAQTLRSGGVDRLAPWIPESQWGVSDWHSSEGGFIIRLE